MEKKYNPANDQEFIKFTQGIFSEIEGPTPTIPMPQTVFMCESYLEIYCGSKSYGKEVSNG